MSTQTFTVVGMTCGHCVAAVTREVEQLPGVTAVEVVLDGGRLTVEGDGITEAAVREAVDEAGYALA